MRLLDQARERLAKIRIPRFAARETIDPPNVTPLWVVNTAKRSKWLAAAIAAYFLWSYCVETSGDQSSALHLTRAGTWLGDLQFWFPLVFGFALVAVAIPLLATNAIAWYVSLTWRDPWPKVGSLVLVIGGSLALIASSFSVMGGAIIEHGRGAAVAVEEVQQGRLAREGERAAIENELRQLCAPEDDTPNYQQQACRAGAIAWTARAQRARAQRDYQADAIERAIPDAARGDQLRAELRAATAAAFAGPTTASVQATPEAADTAGIVAMMNWVKVAWPLIMSVLNDLVCLFAGYIALRLEQKRNNELAMAGPREFDASHAIPDFRDEEPVAAQPMDAPREVVRDAETGEELIHVTPRAHWRRKKGQRVKTTLEPTLLPDETGAVDGGARAGSFATAADHALTEPAIEEAPATIEHAEAEPDTESDGEQNKQTHTDLTDEEYEALAALAIDRDGDQQREDEHGGEQAHGDDERHLAASEIDHHPADERGGEDKEQEREVERAHVPNLPGFPHSAAMMRREAYMDEIDSLEAAK